MGCVWRRVGRTGLVGEGRSELADFNGFFRRIFRALGGGRHWLAWSLCCGRVWPVRGGLSWSGA